MAVPPPKQSSTTSGTPALIPQGEHAGKTTMPMGRVFTLVGSRQRAHLHLLSRSISKAHAIIVNDAGNLYIRDTASREHVYVNGHLVKEADLRNGDLIKIGSFTFKLSDPSGKSGRATVTQTAGAAMEVAGLNMPVLLEGRTWLFGRRPTCDMVLSELAVSNVHAIIFENRGRHEIRDLGSRTGTFVNGQTIHQQPLEFNDLIKIGDHEFRFVAAGADLDELEHLIGTATLGVEQVKLVKADAARIAAEQPAAVDDEDAKLAAAASSADLTELDLNADPDISGSGDTRAIPADRLADTPRMPILSSQVVDDGLADELGIESEERRLLVGADLHEEKLTPTGNFVNVEHDELEEHPPDADLDLIPLSFDPLPVHHDEPAQQEIHEVAAEQEEDDLYFDPALPAPEAVAAPAVGSPEMPDSLLAWANAIVTPDAIDLEPAESIAAEDFAGPDSLTSAEHLELTPVVEPEIPATEDHAAIFDVHSAMENVDPLPLAEPEVAEAAHEMPPGVSEPPAAEHLDVMPILEPEASMVEEGSLTVAASPGAPDVLAAAEHLDPMPVVEPKAPEVEEVAPTVAEFPAAPDVLTAAEHLDPMPALEPEAPVVEEVSPPVAEFPAAPDVLTAAEHLEPMPLLEPEAPVVEEVAPTVAEFPAAPDLLSAAEHLDPMPALEPEASIAEEALPAVVESAAGLELLTAPEHLDFAPAMALDMPSTEELPATSDVVVPAENDDLMAGAGNEESLLAQEPPQEIAESPASPDLLTTAEHLDLAPVVDAAMPAPEESPATSDLLSATGNVESTPITEHESAALAEATPPAVEEIPSGPDVLTTAEQVEPTPIVEPQSPVVDSAPTFLAEPAAGPDLLTAPEHLDLTPVDEPEMPAISSLFIAAENAEPIPAVESEASMANDDILPAIEDSAPAPDVLTAAEHLDFGPSVEPEPAPIEELPAAPDVPVAISDEQTSPEHAELPADLDLEMPVTGEFLAGLDDAPATPDTHVSTGHVEVPAETHSEIPGHEEFLAALDEFAAAPEVHLSAEHPLPTTVTPSESPVAGEFLTALDELPVSDKHMPAEEMEFLPSVDWELPVAGEELAARHESLSVSDAPLPQEHSEPPTASEPEMLDFEAFLAALDGPASSATHASVAPPDLLTTAEHLELAPAPEFQAPASEPEVSAQGEELEVLPDLGESHFGDAVPPPFPAGMTPESGIDAVGIPGWETVRAQTAKLRIPAPEIEPPDANAQVTLSADTFAGGREVLESTEPTPESAQHLEEQIGDTRTHASASAGTMPLDSLTDDHFGVVVQEFAGTAAGALIEHDGDHASTHAAPASPMDHVNAQEMVAVDDLSHATEATEHLLTADAAATLTPQSGDIIIDPRSQIDPFAGSALGTVDDLHQRMATETQEEELTDVESWAFTAEPQEVIADAPVELGDDEISPEHHITSDESAALSIEPHDFTPEILAESSEAPISSEPAAVVDSHDFTAPASVIEPAVAPTDVTTPPEILGALSAGPVIIDEPSHPTAAAPEADEHQFTTDEATASIPEPDRALLELPPELVEPEISHDHSPLVDSHDISADASDMASAVAESSLDSEDILAHEGLLPGYSGDEMVDQAMAFLKHDTDSSDHHDDEANHFLLQAPEEEAAPPAHRYSPMRMSHDSHEEAQGFDVAPMAEHSEEPALPAPFPEVPQEEMAAPRAMPEIIEAPSEPAPAAHVPPVSEDDSGLVFEDEMPGQTATVAPENDAPLIVAEPVAADDGIGRDHPDFAEGDAPYEPPVAAERAVADDGIGRDHPEFAEGDEAPAPRVAKSAAPAPGPVPPVQRPQSMSSVLGLSRDFGSFLGGTPLSLGRGPGRAGPTASPSADGPAQGAMPQVPASPARPNGQSLQAPGGATPQSRGSAPRPHSLAAIANAGNQPKTPRAGRPVFGDVPVTSMFVGETTEILQPFQPGSTQTTPAPIQVPATPVVAPRIAPAPQPVIDEAPPIDPELEITPETAELQLPSDEDSGLEWETAVEPEASAQIEMHPEGAKLFDSEPGALDEISDALDPIGDVTEVIHDEPLTPAPPMNGGLSVVRTETDVPGRNGSGGEKKGVGTEGAAKAKRMTPPPPARSLGRRSPSAQDISTDQSGEPVIPPIDVFSQPDASPDATAASPEIPPVGFIPPGSGPGSRRVRPAGGRAGRSGSNGKSAAPAGKSKGSRKPAVVEELNPAEDDQHEDHDGTSPDHDDSDGSSKASKKKGAKKKWRFPFMGLLILLIAAGAGGAAAWYKMPHSADLRATMRFEKLDRLSGPARGEFEQEQHQRMAADDFRQLAQKIYQNDFNGRAGDGFLYAKAGGDLDLRSIVDASRIEGDRLVFDRKASGDPSGDRLRLQAVLKSLYLVDFPTFLQNAEGRRATLDSARAEFTRTEKTLGELQKNIQDGKKTQAEFEIVRKTEKDLSDRSAKLEKAWSDASSEARKIRAGLDALEAVPVAQAKNDDSELQQMTARLKQVNDALTAASGAHTGDAASAAAALDAALAAYQKEIDKVKAMTPDGSPLSKYLATAQAVESGIDQINKDLANREKVSRKTISDLHGTIAEKIEAHLKRVWAADPQLKALMDVQASHEHRLGAAESAGLTAEAAGIRGQIEVARAAVATRRDQIALAANYPDEIKSLQKLVADQAEQVPADRARAEQRIAEQFKLLAAAAPAPESLSDDQQKLMDGLVDSLVAVSTATRQQQTLASAAGADVKALEAEATDLKAQVEARRRQLADAAAHAAPVPDSPAVTQQRASLATAQQAEAQAFSNWTSSKTDLAKAQSALDRLQSTQPDLVRDNTEYAAVQARHDALAEQLKSDKAFVPVIPVDPAHEDGVQITRASDNRMKVEIGIGALFIISTIALLFRSRKGGVANQSIERLRRGDGHAPVGRRAVTAA